MPRLSSGSDLQQQLSYICVIYSDLLLHYSSDQAESVKYLNHGYMMADTIVTCGGVQYNVMSMSDDVNLECDSDWALGLLPDWSQLI